MNLKHCLYPNTRNSNTKRTNVASWTKRQITAFASTVDLAKRGALWQNVPAFEDCRCLFCLLVSHVLCLHYVQEVALSYF